MAPNPPFVPGDNPTAAKLNGGVYRYAVYTPTIDITNSTTETSLMVAGGTTIAAGHMSSDRMLRLTLIGDYLNNSGVHTITFRIKFGGTTLYAGSYTWPSVATANRKAVRIQVEIGNKGLANSQFGVATFAFDDGGETTAPTTGIGQLSKGASSADMGLPVGWNGTSTIDTAAAQALDVTAQWAAANASISFRRLYGVLELVG